jgi:Flp pilus assembly protein CpaB
VSRRARAAGFAAAAAICAGIAAGATGGPPGGAAEQYGALTDVVVAVEPLAPRRPLGRQTADRALEIRRVPERFVPPDALARPEDAVGRRPAAAIPAGAYLLASQFAAPAERGGGGAAGADLAGAQRPVEIAVVGAAALAGGGTGHVDVVVTTEGTSGAGEGRTYVAAEDVRLLELRATAEEGDGDPLAAPGAETWIATLALTRSQALELIHAESFAREVRLIAG